MIEDRRHNSREYQDLLSALTRARGEEQGTSLSDWQIRNEALSLFVAGHETTANALTWCWYLLSQHPDIFARMHAEGDRVLAGRCPTVAVLPDLAGISRGFAPVSTGLCLYTQGQILCSARASVEK